MDGLVLAGEHEGKALSSLSLGQLQELLGIVREDPDSRALLETYLDGRDAAWRKGAHPDIDAGQGGAPGAGAMADEEAYQILGLKPGAGAADIRKAHRRLTQRMRNNGGAVLLLGRIDEACKVLLSRHH